MGFPIRRTAEPDQTNNCAISGTIQQLSSDKGKINALPFTQRIAHRFFRAHSRIINQFGTPGGI
jgi:hypothetical protein